MWALFLDPYANELLRNMTFMKHLEILSLTRYLITLRNHC